MKAINTPNAPKAIGPYSQAILVNGFLYTSGQVPLNPETGEMVGKTVSEQAEQVFKNLSAVLETSGCHFSDVIKATVFLTTMDDFPKLNEVYAKHMRDHKPARSTVAVSALPKNALVEIELICKVP
ncbi:MAG: RidA family protein [Bdellovibrionales bacterium]|nr:RidA family protein [Bdellovibrionales bacterium]